MKRFIYETKITVHCRMLVWTGDVKPAVATRTRVDRFCTKVSKFPVIKLCSYN
jgi:hypothetical protein